MNRLSVHILSVLGIMIAAPADAGQIVIGLGNGVVVNDPFQKSFIAPEASVAYRFTPAFGLTTRWAWRPNFSQQSYTALSTQLVNDLKISPDLSAVDVEGRLGFTFLPAKVQVGKTAVSRFGVEFGVGTAHSVDDLEALQCEGDPQCLDTESQWHLTAYYGLSGEIMWNDRYGFRVRLDRVRHIETINSTYLEMKTRQLVSADFLIAF